MSDRMRFPLDENGMETCDLRCPKCNTNKVDDLALEERTRYVRIFEAVERIDKDQRVFYAEDDGYDEEEKTLMRVACLGCGHRWVPSGWELQVRD